MGDEELYEKAMSQYKKALEIDNQDVDKRKAIVIYKEVLAKYPYTEAATLSGTRLYELGITPERSAENHQDSRIITERPVENEQDGSSIFQRRGQGAINALRFFAWANLACGIIAAIYIWITMGTKDVYYKDISYSVDNPIAIGIGIAIFIEGIFGCAFFLVISSIGENLIDINEKISRKFTN